MKPSGKQLAAGTMAFNSCKSVVIPDCISAAYDAMTEAMTVEDVPEAVRREIEARFMENYVPMAFRYDYEGPYSSDDIDAFCEKQADIMRNVP